MNSALKFVAILVIILLCLTPVSMLSQENNWQAYLEELAEEGMEETTVDNMFQELSMLESNPLNLNAVSREQLERFPLITLEQAGKIADFLEKNRPIYTVYELRNVSYLDFNTVERILPFFYVGETVEERKTFTEMLKYGKNEMQLRFDKTLNRRAGYGEFSDSILQKYPNRKYRGEDFYHSLKYAFSYRDKIQFGVLGEKDAGEPFFKKNYRQGYDHYGIHLIIRDAGILKTLVLGDFRMLFGQGLILNNNFKQPKAWAADNIILRTQEPRRHFSTAENGFFRGAAAVVQANKNICITAFFSNRKIDANLSRIHQITSFKTDGYHRTLGEMEKKRNSREQVAGINVNFRKNRFQVGVSGLYYSYNRMYNPTLHEYNYYQFRDSAHINASIDYSYRYKNITFAGETAASQNKAVATANMIQYSPSNTFSFSAHYRYFPITFHSMYGNAFSETSGVENENGLFWGVKVSPFAKLSLTGYIDFFRFPWLRYQVDAPSKGLDLYLLATYKFDRNAAVEVRYKLKQKERNAKYPDENQITVLPYATQKWRFRFNKTLESGWDFRTTLDGAWYAPKYFPSEKGWMLSQNIGYRGIGKWRGDFFAGYFDAESYNTRLYSYERNILSTFYMPSFYGEGFRVALSVRYEITPRLSVSVKAGQTCYFDRKTIGSGTEQINGNSRTDIFTYMRWRF